ncbi:MAG: class I SAM-dependent methyltransferase, partial [Chlamydiota bacterium]
SSPLKNRLRKNYQHRRKWAERTKTNCFRLYDRDIKDYPFAIDFYDRRFCVHYFASKQDPDDRFEIEVENVLADLFHAKKEDIYWRTRVRRTKIEQYEKKDLSSDFFVVQEYGVKFWVNLRDYLDTGLFLDHRETRHLIASMAKGKSLLNLFAYTGSFSVHAALGGALFTKTVDMSNTYCAWAENNFRLNKINAKTNIIERADCLKFFDQETQKYDLIVLDPPTLSRSKKMAHIFDIQEDYKELIEKALRILKPNGTLFFSTNSRKFQIDSSLLPPCSLREISSKTEPIDFKGRKAHRCWTIQALT